jgi:tetratricopeptide (TPR) repeat protein
MATLGLSMIVKNEAYTLRACLDSVRGVVSQIVIADTGSTDNTIEVARACGATVFSIPWEDDFAKARNQALVPMKTDWILVLDADEELDAEAKHLLPGLMADREVSGYTTTIRDYMSGRGSYFIGQPSRANHSTIERAKHASSYHDQLTIRLFRNHPEIYYFGRVHELVEYRICKQGLKFVPANILIHHFGHMRELEVRERKHHYYRDLGRIKVKEQPDNPFAWFELGLIEHQGFSNSAGALPCFEEAARLHPPFIRAWLFVAMIEIEMKQPEKALVTLGHAENTEEAAGLRERLKGDALHNLGKISEARGAYQRALELGGPDPLVESKLGYAEVRLGEASAGFEKLRHAVARAPQQSEVHDRLMKACLIVGNLQQAAAAAEHFAACIAQPATFLRAACIHAQLKNWSQAEKLVALGLQLFPHSTDLATAGTEIRLMAAFGLEVASQHAGSAKASGIPLCQP